MGHEEVSEAQDDEERREGLKEVRCAQHHKPLRSTSYDVAGFHWLLSAPFSFGLRPSCASLEVSLAGNPLGPTLGTLVNRSRLL